MASRLHRKNARGFTLVELIVSVLIVIILSGISAVAYNFFVTRSKITACEVNTQGIAKLVQTYSAKWNGPITEMDAAALDVANANGWNASISYSALDYGSSIPGEVKRIQITENVDTSQMELTVTLAEYTGRGLYYPVGEIGAPAQGTLVCEEGGSDGGGGGPVDPGFTITYNEDDVDLAAQPWCPVVTGVGTGTVSYALDPTTQASLAAQGLTFDPDTGCIDLIPGATLPDGYTDLGGYSYLVPFTSNRPVINCGITEAKRLKCWGVGVTGDPEPQTDLPDLDVVDIDDAAVLLSDGSIWYSGSNSSWDPLTYSGGAAVTGATQLRYEGGQLCFTGPDGLVYCGSPASQVTGFGTGSAVGPVRDFAGGAANLCAVDMSGGVFCTGTDTDRQLGQGNHYSLGTVTDPLPLALPAPARALQKSGSTFCALLENGTVACWGDNDLGQVGNGTRTDYQAWPSLVLSQEGQALSGVSQLESSASAFCAVLDNGQVTCWGNLTNALAGDGTVGTYAPYAVSRASDSALGGTLTDASLVTVTDQAYGTHHACVLRTAGSVSCWDNDNRYGQVGDGTTNPTTTPVDVLNTGRVLLSGASVVGTLTTVAEITATSNTFSIALRPSPEPDAPAALTSISTANRLIDDFESTAYTTTSATTGSIVYSTNKTGAELDATDYVFDSGSGSFSPKYHYDRYTQVVVGGNYAQSVGGSAGPDDHTTSVCGLTEDQEVKCWGVSGTYKPTTTYALEDTPKWVPNIGEPVLDIQGGTLATCARTETGKLSCWAITRDGIVAQNTASTSSFAHADNAPAFVPLASAGSLSNVISWGPVGSYGCAVVGSSMSATTGTVYCWGQNNFGQLGRGTVYTGPSTPSTIQFAAAEATAVTAAIGQVKAVSGNCAIDDDSSAWCWGVHPVGTSNPVVYKLNLPGPASAVGGGCALSEGSIYCPTGTLGLGDIMSTGTKLVKDGGALTGVTSYTASGSQMCALVGASEQVWCSGNNLGGVLGDGNESTTSQTNSADTGFVRVRTNADGTAFLDGVTSVGTLAPFRVANGSAGGSCATKPDGTVWCWGTMNNRYFLGNGSLPGRSYAAPAKYTGPYPTLSGVTVTATGTNSVTTSSFTIEDGTPSSSPSDPLAPSGAAPANDLKAGAVALTAGTPASFNTSGATRTNATDPTGSNSTVWFKYTAPAAGVLSVTANAAGWDSHLYALDNAGTVLGYNDDYGTWDTSRVSSLRLSAGQVVYLMVGGFNSSRGTGSITATFDASGAADEFSTAPAVLADQLYAISNSNASSNPATDPASTYSTVWYKYTPDSDGYLDVEATAISWNAKMYVKDASRTNLSTVTTATSNPQVTLVPVRAGNDYYVMLSGYTIADRGPARLLLTLHASPLGDQFADAPALTMPASVEVSTRYAFYDAAQESWTGTSSAAARTVWYSYTPSSNGYLSLEFDPTTGWNTLPSQAELWVRYVDNAGYHTMATGDPSTISLLQVSAGTTYMIAVTSDSASRFGEGTLTADFNPHPVNDLRADAESVSLVMNTPASTTVDTRYATYTASDPAPASRASVWYSFTTTGSGQFTADLATTGTAWNTRMYLLNSSYTQVASATTQTGSKTLSTALVTPGTYYLAVSGYADADRGTADLVLNMAGAPANDTISGAVTLGNPDGSFTSGQTYTYNFDNTLATNSGSTGGLTVGDWGTTLYQSLWYKFTAPAAGGFYTLTANTSGWTAGMYVRNAANTSNVHGGTTSTAINYSNMWINPGYACTAGQVCYINVYGTSTSAKGSGTLTFAYNAPPANDSIAGSTVINVAEGSTSTVSFDNTWATSPVLGTVGDETFGSGLYRGVWFEFALPATPSHGFYTVSASTPGWNSRLIGRNTANSANQGNFGGTSSTPSFTINSYPTAGTSACKPGETCRVLLYGATTTDKGAGTVSVAWVPLYGDYLADVISLNVSAGQTLDRSLDTTNYLADSAKNTTGSAIAYNYGTWFKFTAPSTGNAQFSVARSGTWTATNVRLGVYTDPAGNALSYSNVSAPSVSVPVTAGQDYYILVGSGSTSAGYYGTATLSITAP